MMRAKNCLQAPHAKLIENEFQAKMASSKRRAGAYHLKSRGHLQRAKALAPVVVGRNKTNPLASTIKST
jgi:hypothetical protein